MCVRAVSNSITNEGGDECCYYLFFVAMPVQGVMGSRIYFQRRSPERGDGSELFISNATSSGRGSVYMLALARANTCNPDKFPAFEIASARKMV